MAAPIKKWRKGLLQLSMWENKGEGKDGKEYTNYTYTFERGYKDKEDKWQSTQSIRTQDLPELISLAQMAHSSNIKVEDGS